jgi:uncharacterized membrane protein YjjB (DUF3815 family)
MMSFFFKIPEKVRMILIAIIGGIIGWITYEFIYWINPLHSGRASSSWLLEFIIGTARQHVMHRWFTFRHNGSYWRSLLKAYLYYSITACIGTVINYFLTEQLHVYHRIAWVACLCITAAISLFALKRIVYNPASETRETICGN